MLPLDHVSVTVESETVWTVSKVEPCTCLMIATVGLFTTWTTTIFPQSHQHRHVSTHRNIMSRDPK